ncbi:MAG: WbqC family protein [Planctomycetes bacterium]|nr:WbqC family protein [Planctomycetota bacterium]
MSQSSSRTCVVLQPGYLPWLGFFAQMCRADVFVYLDDVQFDKHGWRNRNRIKGPAGPQWLTVPVRLHGLHQPRINDVLIDPTRPNWASKHLKTLRMNYGACPFFDWLYQDLEQALTRKWTHLAELDIALVEVLSSKLNDGGQLYNDLPYEARCGLEPAAGPLEKGSPPVLEGTFRRSSEMDLPTGRGARLIEICRQLRCDHYYAGAASRAYMDIAAFERAGIRVTFQDYQHPTYPQRYGEFESHLSVVDLLFNCGPDSLEIITSLRPVECAAESRD